MAARGLDIRNVGRRARRHDGCTRTARRSRGVPARASTAGRVSTARRMAVPGRSPRLHPPGDRRESNRLSGGARRGPRRRRDRARRLCDRRVRLSGGRRGTRLRARVRLAHNRTRGDGTRDPRVSRDQRTRSSDPARRPHRDRRRLGAQLSRSSTPIGIPTSPRSRRFATSRAIRRRTRHSSSARASGSSGSVPFLRCERCSQKSG